MMAETGLMTAGSLLMRTNMSLKDSLDGVSTRVRSKILGFGIQKVKEILFRLTQYDGFMKLKVRIFMVENGMITYTMRDQPGTHIMTFKMHYLTKSLSVIILLFFYI